MYRTDYYVAYSLICVLLIAGFAFLLHWTAKAVLGDAPGGGSEPGNAVARLLAAGLFSVCVGYAAMTFHAYLDFNDAANIAEDLATKTGFFFVLLGFLQVLNVLALAVYRRRKDAVTPAAVS